MTQLKYATCGFYMQMSSFYSLLVHFMLQFVMYSDSSQEGEDLNYAALQFSEMKGKRGRRKRETPQESVYSDVRGSDTEGNGQQKISF